MCWLESHLFPRHCQIPPRSPWQLPLPQALRNPTMRAIWKVVHIPNSMRLSLTMSYPVETQGKLRETQGTHHETRGRLEKTKKNQETVGKCKGNSGRTARKPSNDPDTTQRYFGRLGNIAPIYPYLRFIDKRRLPLHLSPR